MSWSSDLPPELLCRPTGLVVLAGLDVTYNAIHKAIWDCFCNNRRPDRVPLQFIVQNIDHEYPKARSKRTSYEWYIPKGILKTSWMKKHLEMIPSVVVVFFDLDWDEHMWKEKQMECATKIEIIRNSLQGRSTRVAVVLIQNNAPLPPGEDVVAAERAASLCSACELSAKSLFVLPHTDHLLGYTIRLENAFYELAQTYYHTEARRVKAHKEFLNKTTHQLLFVRHQFKIAFYNELKQDTHTALKHYKQAYSHIMDLRMHDTNLLEIKTIAGFINYKICRLSFQHNAPLDAIAQFRKHIDFFKSKVGIAELAFEHSAWMSKQFQVFGDLFDEAIKLGLTAIQTQHPGFYYQQAANHAKNRKQLCQGLCQGSESSASPTSNPLELLSHLDYYGQRPWRQGHQSIDPPDAQKEKDGVLALQAQERQVDHSWIIIPLLSSAVAQFKKYKSPRMKRQLMVMMGEEYYDAHDYLKALTLLSRVTWDYRVERWWNLLTSILKTSLKCAYLTANIQEYVTIALELMGKYTETSPEEKGRVQVNLMKVMMNEEPEAEPTCSSASVENARKLWLAETERNVFTIEMQNIIPFVECKASFEASTFTADAPVRLKVFLRSGSPLPIRFNKLSVLLNSQAYNQCVVVDPKAPNDSNNSPNDLCLMPGEIKQHTFSFLPRSEDVGKELEISSLALELGREATSRVALLHWSGAGGDALPPPVSQQANYSNKPPPSGGTIPAHLNSGWESIPTVAITRVEPREAKMEVTLLHEPPCLVNEFYKIKVTIRNVEGSEVSDLQFSFGLKEKQNASLEQTTNVSLDKAEFAEQVTSRAASALGALQPQEETEKIVYIKGLKTGERLLYAKVSYNVTADVNGRHIQCNCHKEQTVMLPTVDPFDVSMKLASLQFEDIDTIHAEEPFLLLTDVKCASPWPIDLKSSSIELVSLKSPYISFDDEFQTQIEGVSLNTDDCASECCSLVTPPGVQATVPMGSYTIHWKRTSSGDDIPFVETTVSLPITTVEHIPIFVDMDLPAYGNVRTKFPVTYNIYNRTPYTQEIEINMEASEAFMFSGHKQVHFRILPNMKYPLQYAMYPLLPGDVQLPRLHVNMLRYPGTMDEIVQKMLVSHVYVKPSGKENGFIMTREGETR